MIDKNAVYQANLKNAEDGKAAYEQILREFDHGPETNTALLMKILDDNKDTEYGKRYGFADIKSIEEYQQNVPVITYEDIHPLIRRMEDGEKNILTAYACNHFNLTSATSGEPKHIPMSREQTDVFLKYDKLYKDGLKAVSLDPSWMEGRAFSTSEGQHLTLPNGITIGDASSVMANYIRGGKATIGSALETLYTSPIEATLPVPHTDTRYIHARFALMDRDITGIVSGFYSLVLSYLKYIADNYELLINDIEKGAIHPDIILTEETRASLLSKIAPLPERAAELREIFKNGADFCFIPRVWPKMIYITGVGKDGFSVYDRIIKENYSGGCLKNIYSGVNASEGLWSVPAGIDVEDSIMAPDSAFFEFLPVDAGDDFTRCVTMAEVEPGKTYELIVTNLCGLYRYRTSDAVEVTGFQGNTPMIRFMYRVNRTINMVSEKTTEKAIQMAVEGAMQELGLELSDYSFYPDTDSLTYVFLVEPMKEEVGVSEQQLAETLMRQMRHLNEDYAHYVDEGLVPPPAAHWLQPQTMKLYRDLMIFKGASANQIKPVRVIINEDQKKFFFGLIMKPESDPANRAEATS
ncbi:MAG: GH3 auxin-responsive promoter family protein [Flexilinea sp.]|nr:GH3 auxin-responsive promoter family protein [Flexilinea sp.]